MIIDEFTDAYSDDLIYLLEGRKSLLTHPLRTEIPYLCNASFCRLYIGSAGAFNPKPTVTLKSLTERGF